MSSPMNWIRKRQKLLMGVFGVLLILSFTVSLGTGYEPLMEFFTGQTSGSSRNPIVVDTDWGSLHESDMEQLRINRTLAARFQQGILERAVAKGAQVREAPLQADNSENELLVLYACANEAKRAGVVITNQEILDYLTGLTDARLEEYEFDEVWKAVGNRRYTQRQLMEILRTELLAHRYREMIRSGSEPASPIQAWELFNRMERRLTVEMFPIEVDAFKDKVGQPTDRELLDLYEAHKNEYPDNVEGRPGFKVPRKRAFSFVKFEFNSLLEAEKKKVTDEQIAEFYEKNKEQFVETNLPESDLQLGSDSKPEDSKPEGQPEMPATGPVVDPAAVPPTPDAPANEPAISDPAASESTGNDPAGSDPAVSDPAVSDPAASDPAASDPAASDPAASNPAASDAPVAESSAAEQPSEETSPAESDTEAKPSEEAPAEPIESVPSSETEPPKSTPTPVPQDETKAEETPASSPAAATSETTATAIPAETAPSETTPSTTPAEVKPAASRYKPLESVREEVRDAIAFPIAQGRLKGIMLSVSTELAKYHQVMSSWEDRRRSNKSIEAPAAPDLQKVTDEIPLKIESIPLGDANSVRNYEIGQTYDIVIQGQGYYNQFFHDVGFQQRLGLFQATTFPTYDDDRPKYVFWVTEDVKPTVPPFKDAGEAVLASWTHERAYQLALEAANAEAAKAKEAGEPLEKCCVKEGRTFIPSTDVHWMVSRSLATSQGMRPALGRIEGIDGVTDSMMRSLFRLGAGDVGVVPNGPKTKVYVARVISEGPEPEIRREMFMREGARTPDLEWLSAIERQDHLYRWFTQLRRERHIVWQREPRPSTRM